LKGLDSYLKDNLFAVKTRKSGMGRYLLNSSSRGFNGSVNIPESCDFDHNFAIKHNCLAFFIKYFFAGKYILNEKSKTNKTVSLKIVWL